MKKSPYQIIRRPLITEKEENDRELRNAYHFEVDPSANKIEIKEALEKIYEHKDVKVVKVRIINQKPKARRFRFRRGMTRKWKKAIITLDEDSQIEIF